MLYQLETQPLTVIDTISSLMLEIDEGWLNHAEKLAFCNQVTSADIQLENILFLAGGWLEQTAQKRAALQCPMLLAHETDIQVTTSKYGESEFKYVRKRIVAPLCPDCLGACGK